MTNEPVPHHLKHWWFCLGGTPAYLFVVMIVTGILLAFWYEATPTRAWESVRVISEDVAYGWFLRSVHRWAATLMVAAVVLHQMRVFFTGAYRRPREFNWLIGMGLLVCTLMAGFTGYSLVYEQLSYWGATVAANLTDNVPVLGPMLRVFLLGGDDSNQHTLLASLFPVPIGPHADPLSTPEVIKPEWFFYVSFRWLKLWSERAAFLSLGAIVLVMAMWPFIDGFIRRKRPGSEASLFVGIVAVLAILGLTVWEALVAHRGIGTRPVRGTGEGNEHEPRAEEGRRLRRIPPGREGRRRRLRPLRRARRGDRHADGLRALPSRRGQGVRREPPCQGRQHPGVARQPAGQGGRGVAQPDEPARADARPARRDVRERPGQRRGRLQAVPRQQGRAARRRRAVDHGRRPEARKSTASRRTRRCWPTCSGATASR
jgi:hypothetical protein